MWFTSCVLTANGTAGCGATTFATAAVVDALLALPAVFLYCSVLTPCFADIWQIGYFPR